MKAKIPPAVWVCIVGFFLSVGCYYIVEDELFLNFSYINIVAASIILSLSPGREPQVEETLDDCIRYLNDLKAEWSWKQHEGLEVYRQLESTIKGMERIRRDWLKERS